MAKIRIISDLHYTNGINGPDYDKTYKQSGLYHYFGKKLQEPADITLIAGDICEGVENHENFLETFFPNQRVIFIDGNHCLTEDTEVLTETGWKYIKDITLNDKVYQYDNGYCELVNPKKLISNTVNELYEFKGTYFNQKVTSKHRMILANNSVELAENLYQKHYQNTSFILTANIHKDEDIDYEIDDNLLRLLVWVITDGTIVLYDKTLQKYTEEELEVYKKHQSKTRIQFHLSKERKIKDLIGLLTNLNYKFTIYNRKKEGFQKSDSLYIRFYSDNARKIVKLLDFKKEFPKWFLKLSKRQLNIVLETLAKTDGMYYINPSTKEKMKHHIVWGHISKNNIDILQALCVTHGYVFKYKESITKSSFNKIHNKHYYLCDIYTKFKENRRDNNVTIIKKTGIFDVYCITVPSGAFLIRSEGITSITGNCVYEDSHPILSEQKKQLKEKFPKEHMFWHYLENDWMWLDYPNIAIIGSTFYTNYKYCDLTLEELNQKAKSWHIWGELYGLATEDFKPYDKLDIKTIKFETMSEARNRLNDFRWGKENKCFYLSPEYYLKLHKKAKKEVKKCHDEILQVNPNAKIILMTHHCLSPQCISEKYKKGLMNASYCSDLENWVDKELPGVRLVVSGHVHNRCDFKFGKRNIRYIINPCGYIPYNEPFNKPKFNPNLFVETDDL